MKFIMLNELGEHNYNEATLITYFLSHQNPLKKENGFNILHAAAYYGLDKLILRVLEKVDGEGLNIQDIYGSTAIHYLASNNRHEALKEILFKYNGKIDLFIPNKKGRTPLHVAAKHLNQEAVEILAESQESLIDILDFEGHSPLSLAYHRNYPGININFNSEVINFLLSKSNYWKIKLDEMNNFPFNHGFDKDILHAWFSGMKHANDVHWIPGIVLEYNNQNFVVNLVIETDLTKFVVLSNTILICLDKMANSAKSFSFERHIEKSYLDKLNKLVHSLINDFQITKIWGIELGGMDAQILSTMFTIEKLILVNSPGLPKTLANNLRKKVNLNFTVNCFFSQNDNLHTNGDYLWKSNKKVKFYTNSQNKNNLRESSSLLDSLLSEIEDNKDMSSLDEMNIKKTTYKEGLLYNEQNDDRIEIDSNSYIESLFNNVNNAIAKLSDNITLKDFARFEYCAHGLAYLHLNDNQKIKWWDNQENLCFQRIIHNNGLYAYLLKNNAEWILMFQGTDFTDYESATRDLDRSSAGIKHIKTYYNQIFKRLDEELSSTDLNIKLIICGHSLGGADAQNFFTSIVSTLAKQYSSENYNPHWLKFIAKEKLVPANFNKLHEIHLYSYNGAGIRNSTAELAKIAIEKLQDRITISINHQRAKDDIVSTVGDTILYDVADFSKLRSLFFNGRASFEERFIYSHLDRQFTDNFSAQNCDIKEGKEAYEALKTIKCEPQNKRWNQLKQLLQKGLLYSKTDEIESSDDSKNSSKTEMINTI